jgi:hypothetical protein
MISDFSALSSSGVGRLDEPQNFISWRSLTGRCRSACFEKISVIPRERQVRFMMPRRNRSEIALTTILGLDSFVCSSVSSPLMFIRRNNK